jgi:hypothetical protein
VKDGKIKSVEEIFLFSLPIKEYQIVDHLLGPALRDEVMKIMPVQKQVSHYPRCLPSILSFLDHCWSTHSLQGLRCCR